MSWPPGWSLVDDGSPSMHERGQVGPGGVDRGGEAGGAGADDDHVADVAVGHDVLPEELVASAQRTYPQGYSDHEATGGGVNAFRHSTSPAMLSTAPRPR